MKAMKTWRETFAQRPTLVAVLALTAVAVLTGSVATAEEPEESISVDQIQSCLAANCHAYRMAFKQSPHSVLDSEHIAEDVDASSSCAACHGEPVRKEKVPGQWSCDFEVFGFDDEDLPGVKSQLCLRCHFGEHGGYASSEHGRAGMACTDCHDIHGRDRGRWPLQKEITVYDGSALQPETPSATCARCHADAFAEFEFNDRHRLQEGIIQCTSCHDPHARQSRSALGGSNRKPVPSATPTRTAHTSTSTDRSEWRVVPPATHHTVRPTATCSLSRR